MAAMTSGENALLVKFTLGIANDTHDHQVLVPLHRITWEHQHAWLL